MTPDMRPIPDGVKVLMDWGEVQIRSSLPTGPRYVDGEHIYLQGELNTLTGWFSQFDGVWIQPPGSSPMMQEFAFLDYTDVCFFTKKKPSKSV